MSSLMNGWYGGVVFVCLIISAVIIFIALMNYLFERDDRYLTKQEQKKLNKANSRLLLASMFGGPIMSFVWPLALFAAVGWLASIVVRDALAKDA